MSIGTLLAYTMVSACVIILRYKQTEEDRTYAAENNIKMVESPFLQQIFNRSGQRVPSEASALVAGVATLLIGWQTTLQEKLKLRITAGVFSFVFCIVLANYRGEMSRGTGLGIFLVKYMYNFLRILQWNLLDRVDLRDRGDPCHAHGRHLLPARVGGARRI